MMAVSLPYLDLQVGPVGLRSTRTRQPTPLVYNITVEPLETRGEELISPRETGVNNND